LLGIKTPRQLDTHPLRGALFENWIIVELLKARWNQGQRSNLYFWRTNTGQEIDLLIETAGQLTPVEIKSGHTFASDWLRGLETWLDLSDDNSTPTLIYGGEDHWQEGTIHILPWRATDSLIPKR
jgi:predicted AAA+ superfamily ATPase